MLGLPGAMLQHRGWPFAPFPVPFVSRAGTLPTAPGLTHLHEQRSSSAERSERGISHTTLYLVKLRKRWGAWGEERAWLQPTAGGEEKGELHIVSCAESAERDGRS